jgi:hypothetical protein
MTDLLPTSRLWMFSPVKKKPSSLWAEATAVIKLAKDCLPSGNDYMLACCPLGGPLACRGSMDALEVPSST